MAKKQIVEHVKQYMDYLASKGISIEQAYLYGSYAKDENKADSDIDVLLVDARFDSPEQDELISTIWVLTYYFDPGIEPFTMGLKAFEYDNVSPITEIIKQEGIKIPA